MPRVARRDSCPPRERYAGNLRVTKVDGASGFSPLCRERGSLLSGGRIKIQYTPVKVFANHPGKSPVKLQATAPGCQQCKSKTCLENGYYGYPYGFRGLPIKPGSNVLIRPRPH